MTLSRRGRSRLSIDAAPFVSNVTGLTGETALLLYGGTRTSGLTFWGPPVVYQVPDPMDHMFESTATTIRTQVRPTVGRNAAFWLLALTLGLLLFASSAPSPLYVVYQSSWGFSAITLTSVFAVYALALLATLIAAGSLSDHVGRRPALLVALAIEMVGMLLFAEARNVEWLFAARTLQGVPASRWARSAPPSWICSPPTTRSSGR